MSDSIKYKDLRPVYQVQRKSSTLFNYLLGNSVLNPNKKLFYQMSKEDIIKAYKELTKEHLLLLENLDDEAYPCQ